MSLTPNYGFCPECGAPGITRQKCLNGNDTCVAGHAYPSSNALKERPVSDVKAFGFNDGLILPWKDLYQYMDDHESDIAMSIDDFGTLKGIFIMLFAREPKAIGQ